MSSPLALTAEMQQALSVSGGLPVELKDPATQKVYLLVEQPEPSSQYDEFVRRQLDEGLTDLAAGNLVAWDAERIKREGRERLAARDATTQRAK
ncbi:hypothetical protein [Lacipirellula sp.]|uniref:hypothetical protein n=1 Tax=Lacipirellula sp. TaxID=2691419 RepID=UPI003D115D3F